MTGLRVVYLGKLADVAGCAQSEFAMPLEGVDWGGFVAILRAKLGENIAEAACAPSTKVALNGSLVPSRDSLVFRPGDEVALLPPVSGG